MKNIGKRVFGKGLRIAGVSILCMAMLSTVATVHAAEGNETGKTLDFVIAGDVMPYNNGTVKNNLGNIMRNSGVIDTNKGLVNETWSNSSINYNAGTVLYNQGVLSENRGTVTANGMKPQAFAWPEVTHNYSLVDQNYGLVANNETGAIIKGNNNGGIVTSNRGTVEDNGYNGTITENTSEGTITKNSILGTVLTNNGTIDTNTTSASVNINNGTITDNFGIVTTNSGEVTNTYVMDGNPVQGTVGGTAALNTYYPFSVGNYDIGLLKDDSNVVYKNNAGGEVGSDFYYIKNGAVIQLPQGYDSITSYNADISVNGKDYTITAKSDVKYIYLSFNPSAENTETNVASGSTLPSNTKVLVLNEGTVTDNSGWISDNSNIGTVDSNSGTVLSNSGTVTLNTGDISVNGSNAEAVIVDNQGHVQLNSGKITNNGGGTEETKGTIDASNGTVTNNAAYSMLINQQTGTVTTNAGTIHHVSSSSSVVTNSGQIDHCQGTVTTNDGTISHLSNSLTTNNGTIESIYSNSTVVIGTNSAEAVIGDIYNARVDNNLGTINLVAGKDDVVVNSGTIVTNFGQVTNKVGGVVTNNYGVVTVGQLSYAGSARISIFTAVKGISDDTASGKITTMSNRSGKDYISKIPSGTTCTVTNNFGNTACKATNNFGGEAASQDNQYYALATDAGAAITEFGQISGFEYKDSDGDGVDNAYYLEAGKTGTITVVSGTTLRIASGTAKISRSGNVYTISDIKTAVRLTDAAAESDQGTSSGNSQSSSTVDSTSGYTVPNTCDR